MKKIEMGKKYACFGEAGTVRYMDGKNKIHPVLWERSRDGEPCLFGEDGHNHFNDKYLVEVPLYSDIPIDTPGWARMTDLVTVSQDLVKLTRGTGGWVPRHFAGVSELTGRPLCYSFGASKHTADGSCEQWDEFTTTKPKEATSPQAKNFTANLGDRHEPHLRSLGSDRSEGKGAAVSDYYAPATNPKARKEHVCINCGGPILVGEKYMQQTGFYEGRAFRNRFHVECWDELIDGGLQFEFSPYSGEYPDRVRAIVEATTGSKE